jgi:hypothetical protein
MRLSCSFSLSHTHTHTHSLSPPPLHFTGFCHVSSLGGSVSRWRQKGEARTVSRLRIHANLWTRLVLLYAAGRRVELEKERWRLMVGSAMCSFRHSLFTRMHFFHVCLLFTRRRAHRFAFYCTRVSQTLTLNTTNVDSATIFPNPGFWSSLWMYTVEGHKTVYTSLARAICGKKVSFAGGSDSAADAGYSNGNL